MTSSMDPQDWYTVTHLFRTFTGQIVTVLIGVCPNFYEAEFTAQVHLRNAVDNCIIHGWSGTFSDRFDGGHSGLVTVHTAPEWDEPVHEFRIERGWWNGPTADCRGWSPYPPWTSTTGGPPTNSDPGPPATGNNYSGPIPSAVPPPTYPQATPSNRHGSAFHPSEGSASNTTLRAAHPQTQTQTTPVGRREFGTTFSQTRQMYPNRPNTFKPRRQYDETMSFSSGDIKTNSTIDNNAVNNTATVTTITDTSIAGGSRYSGELSKRRTSSMPNLLCDREML